MSGGWTPLLEGGQRDTALERIDAIARELLALEFQSGPDPSLATGLAGIALFFAYLPAELAHHRGPDRAEELITRAVQSAGLGSLGPELFEGVTGVMWALEHLVGPRAKADESDPLLPFERSLESIVTRAAGAHPYDLLSGFAGAGIYALDRLHSPSARSCLAAVLQSLDDRAVAVGEGMAWPTPPGLSLPVDDDRQSFDLGVAHGLAGVIGFLSRAHAVAAAGTAERLLRGAVACLLAQERPGASGGRFPYTTSFSGPADGRPPRIAWCYGDAGAAAALYRAGTSLGMPDWVARATDLARNAAALSPERCGVDDTGLCHGSAGIAHILNRIGQASGDRQILEGARRWYGITLDMWRAGEGVAGFPAWSVAPGGVHGWLAEPGLLEGAAGVGLALSAAVGSEPDWDSILVTSLSPSGRSAA